MISLQKLRDNIAGMMDHGVIIVTEEIKNEQFIKSLQEKLWAGEDIRANIESAGFSLTPCNFYSSTPSLFDIENSFEYLEENPPYLSSGLFKNEKLNSVLKTLCQYSSEFSPPLEGDEIECKQFFWKNTQFGYSDAMAYYAFIRHYKPQNVIEIGSGFSSLVALEALQKNEHGRLTCIEPYPRSFLENRQDLNLRKIRAQDLFEAELNEMLNDGDILFIDSTHTVKTGSDCLHIYLRCCPISRKMSVFTYMMFSFRLVCLRSG